MSWTGTLMKSTPVIGEVEVAIPAVHQVRRRARYGATSYTVSLRADSAHALRCGECETVFFERGQFNSGEAAQPADAPA